MLISKTASLLYGRIIVLSVLIGIIYISYSLKNEIKKDRRILLFYILYIPFAFIFGKLYTFIIYNSSSSFLTSGLSAYGGLIGTIACALIFEKMLPNNGKIIKYSILSLPLVYGLTKIGCFLSGCCSGIPYSGLLNVTYTDLMNIKQFPIQLVESIVFICIFLLCNRRRDKKDIEFITLLTVFASKFILDFLRYDHLNLFITPNQVFSIVAFISTIVVFVLFKKKKLTKLEK